MERTEYMEMAAYCLSEEDCRRLFDRDRDEMLDGTAVWNESLEAAYNDYCNNQDEDEDEGFDAEIAEGFAGNMPCDNTGYCDPMHCPIFHECEGQHH